MRSRKKQKSRPLLQWLYIREMNVPDYYRDLFPLGRDNDRLRRGFERFGGYNPAYPVTVRPIGSEHYSYEIICGVQRYDVSMKAGMSKIPAVVQELDDTVAYRRSIEDHFYGASLTPMSLIHAEFLSRVLRQFGGEVQPKFFCETLKASETTYRRAVIILDCVLEAVAKNWPEIAGKSLAEQVATIIRDDLIPEFTALFAERMEVYAFYKGKDKIIANALSHRKEMDVSDALTALAPAALNGDLEGAKDNNSPSGESRNPDSELKVEEALEIDGESPSSDQHVTPLNIEETADIAEETRSCSAKTQDRTDNSVGDTESESLNLSFSLRGQAIQEEPSQTTETKQETNRPIDGALTGEPTQGDPRVSKKSAKSRRQRKPIPQPELMFTDE